MEALTDGIFAIAMTLLVLELKIPDLPRRVDTSELLQKIGEEGPAFFSFMISFLYCGLLWVMYITWPCISSVICHGLPYWYG